jgi:outer membrane receptor for ferric coprogen and ferric-rhodotorulic acid
LWDYETTTTYPRRTAPVGYDQKAEFTPYLGVVQDLTGNLSAYASYADIFTPQSQRTVTNKQLDPMRGKQLEAGLKSNLLDDRLLLSAAIYRIEQSNRAYADPDNTGFYLALGEVESKGIELEANGRLTENWTLNAGYAFNKNKYKRDASRTNEGQSAQPVIPKHSFKLFTNYSITDGSLEGLSLGGGVNWLSATEGGLAANRVANGIATLVQQDAYAVFSLRAGYKLTETISINANLENALDKVYYARINATGRGNFYGAPRNFFVSLRAAY